MDEDYRGELFPRELDNSALTVYINVSILAFPKIDTLQLYYTADFVLSMRWHDPRLVRLLNYYNKGSVNFDFSK